MAISKKSLSYGSLGLLSTSFGYITNKQLKSIYFFIKKNIPKNEQFWINVYPNTSITKKSIGSRMGKGKGSITLWVYPIKTNIVFIEFSKNNSNSRKVAYLIKHKLNIKYKNNMFLANLNVSG